MAQKSKWTIIILINAENDLIFQSVDAFNKLGVFGSTADANFVVLFDGLPVPGMSADQSGPRVYLIKKYMKFDTAVPYHVFKESDHLSDPEKLAGILSFIKTEFEAENYGFIYKGHGGAGGTDITDGKFFTTTLLVKKDSSEEEIKKQLQTIAGSSWNFEGYCEYGDEKNIVMGIFSKFHKVLTYKGLSAVLNAVFPERQLSFVCLDCCWGQQIEHAYTFRDTTKYFVASADEMPALGLGYKDLCLLLGERAKMLPEELSSMLVAIYFVNNYADYDSEVLAFRKMGVSLTAVNTNNLKNLIPLFNKICEHLANRIDIHYATINQALSMCLDYTYDLNRDEYGVYNIDLIWFLENMIHFNKEDEELNLYLLHFIHMTTLYFIKGYMGNNYKETIPGTQALGGKGVSIAFPRNKEELEQSIYFGRNQPDFVKHTEWKNLLIKFYAAIEKRKANGFESVTPEGLEFMNGLEVTVGSKWSETIKPGM